MHGWPTAHHTCMSELILWMQRLAQSENKQLQLQSSNIDITLITGYAEHVLPHTDLNYMF